MNVCFSLLQGNASPYPNIIASKMRHAGAVYCTALTDEERVISGSGDNKVFMLCFEMHTRFKA